MDTRRLFVCDDCEKPFSKKFCLQRHQRARTCKKPKKPKEHKCLRCQKVFTKKCHLDRHVESEVCQKEAIKHECSMCQASFTRKRNLAGHIMKEHPTEAHVLLPDFKCPDCLKTFAKKNKLDLHKESGYCEKVEIRHTCSECGKIYKFKKRMLKHMRDYHPDNAAPKKPHRIADIEEFRCSQCGEICVNGRELRTHIDRAHVRKPPDNTTEWMTTFRCSECDIKFERKAELIQHNNENHTTPDSDDEPFDRKVKCPHKGCEDRFENRTSLVRHKLDHPPAEDEELGVDAVFCDFCNMGFEEVEELNKHKRDDHDVPDTCGVVEQLLDPLDDMNPLSLYTRVGEHIVDNAGKKLLRTVRTRDSFRFTRKALMLCEAGLGIEVFQKVIASLVKDITKFKRGRIQIKVLADSLDTPIVMPLVIVAVFTPMVLINYMEHVLSSKDQLLYDDTLTFEIIHVDID